MDAIHLDAIGKEMLTFWFPVDEETKGEETKGVTKTQYQQSLQSIAKQIHWDKTRIVRDAIRLCENQTARFLIANLSIPSDCRKRRSFSQKDRGDVCVDDLEDRYEYLVNRLSLFPDEKKDEKYHQLCLKFEQSHQQLVHARMYKTNDLMDKMIAYNRVAHQLNAVYERRDCQEVVEEIDMADSQLKLSEICRLNECQLEADIVNPSMKNPFTRMSKGKCCSEFATCVELAFDLIQFGSIEQVKKVMGGYYQIKLTDMLY
jgi:hypothetical protein